eukprot:696879-Prymnesium_polylepis.1
MRNLSHHGLDFSRRAHARPRDEDGLCVRGRCRRDKKGLLGQAQSRRAKHLVCMCPSMGRYTARSTKSVGKNQY